MKNLIKLASLLLLTLIVSCNNDEIIIEDEIIIDDVILVDYQFSDVINNDLSGAIDCNFGPSGSGVCLDGS